MKLVRPKLGVAVDHVIRTPDVLWAYNQFINLIKGVDVEDGFPSVLPYFFQPEMEKPEIIKWYLNNVVDENDLVFNWFYNPEHRIEFLNVFGDLIFAKSNTQNREVISTLNLFQAEIGDVIIIERIQYPKKIQHTFGFFSKVNLFPSQVIFFNSQEKLVEYTNTLGFVYDPITDKTKPTVTQNQKLFDSEVNPIHEFSKFILNIEQQLK